MVDPARPPATLRVSATARESDASPPRRRRPPIAGHWFWIVGASIVLGGWVVLSTFTPVLSPGPSNGPGASGPSLGYLVSVAELRERATLAARGVAPYAEAVDRLIADGDKLLDHAARPIQPLRIDAGDGTLTDDAAAAYGLALAYRLSDDARYGRKAAEIVRAWVRTTTFVEDACPNDGGCHTTLVVSRMGAAFVFTADLLAGTDVWTGTDDAALKDWLGRVILPAASERKNNWGDAGTLLRVAITDYIGDELGFERALDHWRALLDMVRSDGSIPEETRRFALGLQYTQEALQYKVAVAEIAGRRGIDLWSYEGRDGGTLRAAMDVLAEYWFRPSDWPWHDQPVEVPAVGPVWELAYAHWRDPAWIPIIAQRRPFGDAGHSALRWTTATSGIETSLTAGPGATSGSGASPAGPGASPAGPGGSPPSATPTPTAAALVLGDPQLRLAAPPAAGQVEIGLTWPLRPPLGVPDATMRLEIAAGDGPFAAVAPATVAGQEVVITVPIDRTIRMRAALLDAAGSPTAWAIGPTVVARIHDDADPAFAFDGDWSPAGFAGYIGGSAASSDAAGAVATLTVDAYAAMVVGPVGPTRGSVSVTIDGAAPTTVDRYQSRFEPATVIATAAWPSRGRHTVRFEVLGSPSARPTVGIDAAVTIEPAR